MRFRRPIWSSGPKSPQVDPSGRCFHRGVGICARGLPCPLRASKFRPGRVPATRQPRSGRSTKWMRMPPVLLGWRNAIFEPRAPGRGVSSITERPAALASRIASSTSATRSARWWRPWPRRATNFAMSRWSMTFSSPSGTRSSRISISVSPTRAKAERKPPYGSFSSTSWISRPSLPPKIATCFPRSPDAMPMWSMPRMRMVAVPLAESGRLGGRDNSTRPAPVTSVYWNAMLPRTADIVIIGAGAIGSSIAYHLSRRGARDVAVLERESIGSGSTSKAAGGIRVQFATRVEIEFSLRGIGFFKRFEDEMGVPCDFHQEGYLFVVSSEHDVARFRTNVALQQSMGADVRMIAPDDARALVPGLRVDDTLAAVWGPTDGYASPNDVVQAYAARARAG